MTLTFHHFCSMWGLRLAQLTVFKGEQKKLCSGWTMHLSAWNGRTITTENIVTECMAQPIQRAPVISVYEEGEVEHIKCPTSHPNCDQDRALALFYILREWPIGVNTAGVFHLIEKGWPKFWEQVWILRHWMMLMCMLPDDTHYDVTRIEVMVTSRKKLLLRNSTYVLLRNPTTTGWGWHTHTVVTWHHHSHHYGSTYRRTANKRTNYIQKSVPYTIWYRLHQHRHKLWLNLYYTWHWTWMLNHWRHG